MGSDGEDHVEGPSALQSKLVQVERVDEQREDGVPVDGFAGDDRDLSGSEAARLKHQVGAGEARDQLGHVLERGVLKVEPHFIGPLHALARYSAWRVG